MIKRLHLNLYAGESFDALLEPSCSLPRGSLHELRLEVPHNEKRISPPTWNWEITKLLNRLPPIRKLQISATATLRLNPSIFTSIHKLVLIDVQWCDPQSLLNSLPQLQSLELRRRIPDCITKTWDRPALIHHQLVFIRIEWMGRESVSWFNGLSFPNLQTLNVTEGILTPDIFPFISSHPSIKNIENKVFPHVLRELEQVAPQLTHLTLRHDLLFNLQFYLFHEFKHLRSLKIRDDDGYFRQEEFDRLVQMRCLPSSHDQCQRPAHIDTPLELLIIVNRRYRSSASLFPLIPWRKSSLIKESTRNETEGSTERILSWI